MRLQRILTLALATGLAANGGAGTPAVLLEADPAGGFRVATATYTARVDAAGGLVSLEIGGVQFLAPPVGVTRAGEQRTVPPLFACHMGQWWQPYPLPGGAVANGGEVRAEGQGWAIRYAFEPDAILLEFSGAPAGGRSFRAGYPPAELCLNLAPNLARACDPGNQGELGWPVARKHEPGDLAVLAANGAGLVAEGASWITAVRDPGAVAAPPHRLDLLVFNTYDQSPEPVRHRLRLFAQAPLSHALTLAVESPNPDHLFAHCEAFSFICRVGVLYGQAVRGRLRFTGSPYVWHKPEFTADVPLAVEAGASPVAVPLPLRPPQPGHYTGRIEIVGEDGKTLYAQRVGFLFQPERIPAAEPPPDFDAFWDRTLAELEKIPLDLTKEERKDLETPAGRCFKIGFRSWGGRWAWAWLYEPKAAGRVAATLRCPAVSVWQPGQAHAAGGQLWLDAAVHGGDLADYPAKPDFDYMNTGITSREEYMLRYSYCSLVRCFDILKSHPQCDGTVNVVGGSQGGGLALMLAGLRQPAVVSGTAVALCRIDWTVLGYTQWGPSCPPGADKEAVAQVVRYYDPACFAHRVRSPLRFAIGLFDFCAPAEGLFSAFNALPVATPCQVMVDPYGGHFTIDTTRFNAGKGLVDVPRWQGTAADNKLVR